MKTAEEIVKWVAEYVAENIGPDGHFPSAPVLTDPWDLVQSLGEFTGIPDAQIKAWADAKSDERAARRKR